MKYIKPDVEFVKINTEDIILTSQGSIWDLPEIGIPTPTQINEDYGKLTTSENSIDNDNGIAE